MPRLFLCWVAALIGVSWTGIALAEASRFSAGPPLVAGACAAIVAAFSLRGRWVLAARPAWIAPVLALALVPTVLPAIDTTLLSQDASVHRASGIWLARTGSLGIEDAALVSLTDDERMALFGTASVSTARLSLSRLPGGVVLPDLGESTSFPSFSHLLAVWIAIAWQVAGDSGIAALGTVFAFSAWWAIGWIALLDRGWVAALLAPTLLASWLPEHWFARFLMPEILAQALVWCGVAAARLAERPGAQAGFGRPAAWVAGASLGVAAFARLEQLAVFLPSLLLARALVPSRLNVLPRGAALPFALVIAHAGLHLWLVPTDYGNRIVKHILQIWWKVVVWLAAWVDNDGYALQVLVLRRLIPGALLAGALWLAWTWQRSRRHPGFAVRANAAVVASAWLALLYVDGLAAEFPGFRSLFWYVPWPVWGAVAAGLGSLRLLPPLELALAIEALDQLVSARVSIEQIWAARRLVTVVLPLVALAAARGAASGLAFAPVWSVRIARALAAVGLLLGVLSMAPVAGRRLQEGGAALAAEIAAALPGEAVVVVAPKLDWTHLAAALWLEHGRVSLVWRDHPDFESALERYLAATDQRPFLLAGAVVAGDGLLAPEDQLPAPLPGFALKERGRFASRGVMLEAPRDRPPRGQVERRIDTVLYELVPEGEPSSDLLRDEPGRNPAPAKASKPARREMSQKESVYRVFGMELSPYSVKVRSYVRYKRIPHEWVVRNASNQEEFQRYAKLPLVPLVVTPEGQGLQDSTPIIDTLEERFPEPSVHPADPTLRFLSALLEEFGDEWGNKWMFHYRWAREVDQRSGAERLVRDMLPGVEGEALHEAAEAIRQRMVGRVWFVGSSSETAPQIEASYLATLDLLEAHLVSRPYLFGGRPVFADFGLWGQLYEAGSDPTPGGLLRERAPSVARWVERMLSPRSEGALETWPALAPTLTPLLARQVGALFLPWSDANAKAIAAGSEVFTVELDGHRWTQKPQKYHARSLAALRARYALVAGNPALDRILAETGCLPFLRN